MSIFDNARPEDEESAWKLKIVKFLDGFAMTILMTTITIAALFMDDLRLACFPAALDNTMNVLTIIFLALFATELGWLGCSPLWGLGAT